VGVDSDKVKQLRKSKLWSQEELADQASLGLRTLQRIEQSGTASQQSIKRLALALEVAVADLLIISKGFTPYSHKQIGYFTLIGLGMVLSFMLSIGVYSYFELNGTEKTGALFTLGASTLIISIVGILFSSLTISVNSSTINWSFAFGFWKKQLDLSEVASAHVVQNTFLNGFGIRVVGNGWLYNVSGFAAVELKLKGGSVVRLGTDEPEYLKHAVNSALEQTTLCK
jgi:transcriptional regulator with XRE-family HTH domain